MACRLLLYVTFTCNQKHILCFMFISTLLLNYQQSFLISNINCIIFFTSSVWKHIARRHLLRFHVDTILYFVLTFTTRYNNNNNITMTVIFLYFEEESIMEYINSFAQYRRLLNYLISSSILRT